jgi:hypothetical protein
VQLAELDMLPPTRWDIPKVERQHLLSANLAFSGLKSGEVLIEAVTVFLR